MKIILSLLFCSQLVFAADFCKFYLDPMTSNNALKDIKRIKKIEGIEKRINWIRSKKVNPKMIEVDRYFIENLLNVDDLLHAGKITLVQKQWRTLFRNTEIDYYQLLKDEIIITAVFRSQDEDITQVLNTLLKVHEKDKLLVALVHSYLEQKITSKPEFIKFLQKTMRQEAQNYAKEFRQYTLTREHIKHLIESEHCSSHCRVRAKKLMTSLGVSSPSEQKVFPFIEGLESPNLKEMEDLILRHPAAHEKMLYQAVSYELKALIKDIVISPEARHFFIQKMYKLTPKKLHKSIAVLERVLLDEESRVNHFPLINGIQRKRPRAIKDDQNLAKHLKNQLTTLKTENVAYKDDQLLVTFARKVDHQTEVLWKELLHFAKTDDPDFHKRMVFAQKKAKTAGDISTTSKRSNLRALISLTILAGATKGVAVTYDKMTDDGDNKSSKPKAGIFEKIGQKADSAIETVKDIKKEAEEIIEVTEEVMDDAIDIAESIVKASDSILQTEEITKPKDSIK